MAAKRSELLAEHFIRTVGIRAIVVSYSDGNTFRLLRRSSVGLTAKAASMRRQRGQGRVVLWCRNEKDAERVVAAAVRLLTSLGNVRHENSFSGDIAVARAALGEASRAEGVTLTEHETVIRRANEAVASVEQMFARMQESGEMQRINRDYREGRLRSAEGDLRYVSYNDYVHHLKKVALDNLAHAGSAKQLKQPD